MSFPDVLNHSLLRSAQVHFQGAKALDSDNVIAAHFLSHVCLRCYENTRLTDPLRFIK